MVNFDPPFWVMPDQYIKYLILKLLRKKPIWSWDAEELDDRCIPGIGFYISDGVYQSSHSYWSDAGYTPMWKEEGP